MVRAVAAQLNPRTANVSQEDENENMERPFRRPPPPPLTEGLVNPMAGVGVTANNITPSAEVSPCSTLTELSPKAWMAPHQSLTILDWDDTLFPSTWLTETNLPLCEPCPQGRHDISEPMARLAPILLEFIQAAKRVSTVVILTNASVGWVRDACVCWMPILLEEVENTQIIYARDVYARSNMGQFENVPDNELPLRWKITAMKQCMQQFYGEGHSWKNVFGIGDSPHDQYALQQVCAQHINPFSRRTNQPYPMRVKTICTPLDPTIQQVEANLRLLSRYFVNLLQADCQFDIDVEYAYDPFAEVGSPFYEMDSMSWWLWTQGNRSDHSRMMRDVIDLFDPHSVGELTRFASTSSKHSSHPSPPMSMTSPFPQRGGSAPSYLRANHSII